MIRILENCLLFDGVDEEPRPGQSVLIEDEVIREVGEDLSGWGDAERRDLGGRFLMPGLIDAHFHAYGTALNPAETDRLTPQLRALHARAALESALQRGFTTIRDAGGGDVSLARALHLGLIDGPRFFYAGLALSQTGGHGDLRAPDHFVACACGYCGAMSKLVDGADQMRAAVREELRQGATQIKLFVSGGVLSPSDPYWMNQFSEEEIRVAVEEAATRRVYVMAHAHTNDAVLRCLRNGVRSIEHATSLESDGAQAIVESGAFAVPTLAIIEAIVEMGEKMGLPPAMLAKARGTAADALRSIELLRAAGARIGFGTDLLGPLMSRQLNEFRLRSEVCPPIEILRSATSVNAALLGMEGRLGCIAPGAFADLVAIDGNPLADIGLMEDQSRMAMVIRGGVIVRQQAAR